MIQKNKPIYQLINWLTYVFLLATKKKHSTQKKEVETEPIWIMGMFRSGTSLTTRILSILGVDLGPEKHLLKGQGTRRSMNPDGFFENYLFMDWSLKVFLQLDSWGHIPPNKESVNAYDQSIGFKEFARHSIMDIHDDRISNWNKVNALRSYAPENFEAYFQDCFKAPFAVKNPHFSVLYPILLKRWPKSRILVVFRDPDDVVASAKQVTSTADYALYFEYYSRLLLDENVTPVYFSYDRLISDPEKSIKILAKEFGLEDGKVEDAAEVVRTDKKPSTQTGNADWPEHITDLYQEMNQRAINR